MEIYGIRKRNVAKRAINGAGCSRFNAGAWRTLAGRVMPPVIVSFLLGTVVFVGNGWLSVRDTVNDYPRVVEDVIWLKRNLNDLNKRYTEFEKYGKRFSEDDYTKMEAQAQQRFDAFLWKPLMTRLERMEARGERLNNDLDQHEREPAHEKAGWDIKQLIEGMHRIEEKVDGK